MSPVTVADPYKVLGVSPEASDADIKRAYRTRAKQLHPDAGGSAAAMAELNAAYRQLSEPGPRPAATRSSPSRPHPTPTPPDATSSETHHPTGAQPAQDYTAERINRERTRWARRSAWRLWRTSAPAAIIGFLANQFALAYAQPDADLTGFHVITFIPVFLFGLATIFLIDPALRLTYADVVRRYPTTPRERLIAFVLIISFIPLAWLWVYWR